MRSGGAGEAVREVHAGRLRVRERLAPAKANLAETAALHPDDSDTTESVETWREELFGEHGALNDKLIGAAA